jgi:hypothetical protein
MDWLEYAYVAFLIYVGWCSVRSSARAHGRLVTAFELITSVAWPVLVTAFFSPRVAAALGRATVPLFAVATAWTAYTVWRDFRPAAMAPRLPAENRRARYVGVLAFCAAIVVPVVVLGAIVAGRALQVA